MKKPKAPALALSRVPMTDDYRPCIGHKENFETMRKASADGNLCLLEVTLAATGERCAAICAVNREKDGGVTFVPLGIMFNDDPYKMLLPPG